MATPVADYYSAPSGVTLYAGRFTPVASAILSGAAALGSLSAGGALAGYEVPASPGIPGAISLLSTTTQTAPFSYGAAFKRGDIPSGQGIVVTGATAQAKIINTWSDGSAKFAIVSGSASLTAATPLGCTFTPGTASTGTALTTSDLATALTSGVTVGAGAFGSAVFGAGEWAAPFSTEVSGHRMSSWTFRKQIGSDAHLVAWLEVRLFLGGAVEVLPWVENGYTLVTGPTQKSATYTFTLGGTSRFSAAIDLLHHQRTVLISGTAISYWLGTDPNLTVIHDTDYMQDTGLVPVYMSKVAQDSAKLLDGIVSYTPLDKGNFYKGDTMASGGAVNHIALLTQWEAIHLSGPSDRTYRTVIYNSFGMGRNNIHYRDEADGHRWARLSQHPTLQAGREPGGGFETTPATTGTQPPYWDFAHQPANSFLAYLLTGRAYFRDEVQATASFNALGVTAGWRSNGQGLFQSNAVGNTRHAAWCLRALAHAIAATPDANTTVQNEYRTQYENNVNYYHSTYVTAGNSNNPCRFVQDVDYYPTPDGEHKGAPWQQDYLTASLGYARDLGMNLSAPVEAKLVAFFDWHAPSIVGRLGTAGASDYLYRDYGSYTIIDAPADNPDYAGGTGPWFANWGAVYEATRTALVWTFSKEEGPTRAWNVAITEATSGLAAIAYCVKHNSPGAEAAYQRLTSASDWGTIIASLDVDPMWAIGVKATPKWARGLAVNQWKEITGTASTSLVPTRGGDIIINGVSAGTARYASRFDAYCGMTVDTRRSTIWGSGGGHGDYYGNELIKLNLHTDDPTWAEQAPGSAAGPQADPGDSTVTIGRTLNNSTTTTIYFYGAYPTLVGKSAVINGETRVINSVDITLQRMVLASALSSAPAAGVNIALTTVSTPDGYYGQQGIRYADYLPGSRHTYYGQQFIERHGRYINTNGSLSPSGVGVETLESFNADVSGNAGWDEWATYPNLLGNQYGGLTPAIVPSVTKDPSTDIIYAISSNRLWAVTPSASGPGSVVGSGGTSLNYWLPGEFNPGSYTNMAVDTTRNRMFWGNPAIPRTIDLSTKGVNTHTFSGASAATFGAFDKEGLGLLYDPYTDYYYARARAAGSTVYKINPITFEISLVPAVGSVFPPASAGSSSGEGHGIYNKWQVVKHLRGIVYMPAAGGNVWFMRLY